MHLKSLNLYLCLTFFFVSGCGSDKAEPPVKVYPVTGRVTWKGEPVQSADITFFNAEAKRSAFGRTDEKGYYELTTFAAKDGAVEGKHTVTVTKVEVPPTEVVADIETEAYVPPEMNKPTKPVKPKALLPEIYSDSTKSTLIGVVEPNSKNSIDFELK